jgi:hypothetical protein
VEDHPPHRHLRLQLGQQVPRNGLALAVLVGGEQEFVGVGQASLEVTDRGLLARRDHVQRFEVGLDVHARPCPLLALVLGRYLGRAGGQVADVAAAGFDHVAGAEELGQADSLGRRLDDDEPTLGSSGHGGFPLDQAARNCGTLRMVPIRRPGASR